MSYITSKEQARFDTKWKKEGDCHNWTSPLDRDGYGTFYLRRLNRRAARVAWFAAHGPIPAGMVINHNCRNRKCVNVQHLRLLSTRDNSLIDSTSRSYINSQKTHCPHGHAYDKVNQTKRGPQRGCSTCDRAKSKRLHAKWRAENKLAV